MTEIHIPYHSGRLAVLADLHLDHWGRANRNPLRDFRLEELLRSELDAVLIAGDLINGPPANMAKALEFLASYVPIGRIYVLPGNHDYYRSSLMAEPEMSAVLHEVGGHFLQQSILHHGTTRILAATLWTDYNLLGQRAEAMDFAAKWMNDHRAIARSTPDPKNEFEVLLPPMAEHRVTPQDLRSIHLLHRAWLESELARSHPAGKVGQTVVVTHHGPHPEVAGNIDKLTPAFHSDLSDILERYDIDVWFFGHSHRHHRATISGCDVRNISLGYPEERHNRLGYLEDACLWDSPRGS